MKIKRLVTLALCALMLLSACLTPGFAALEETRDYTPGQYADVDEGSWSAPYIAEVYSLGLMNGTGETSFDPKGNVSVAQSVTVAVRLNDLYAGGDGVIEGAGEHWYDPAVQRATERGILSSGLFDSYERPATRAEIALLLVRALPASEFAPIREVGSLPDVYPDTPCAAEVFTLYRAGILTGNDAYGTFTPTAELTREALAAILCRVCRPETRFSTPLEEVPPDMTARTCSLLVELGGIPLYGAITVAGDYYLPLQAFFATGSGLSELAGGDKYNLDFFHKYRDNKEITLPDYSLAPPDWVALGTAERAADYEVRGKAVRHMTLGGRYDMFSLADMADGPLEFRDGRVIVPFAEMEDISYSTETDLVGEAAASLIKGTTRDTLKAFHDYLVNTLSYGYPSQRLYRNDNIDTLANRMGVCADYSRVFEEMCIRSGIPCELVVGDATNGPHGWNRVWVDGEWLYVDVTWDDPIGGSLVYTYFLVDAEKMVMSRFWYDDDYPFAMEYDPAWEELDPKRIDSPDMFRKCLLAQIAIGVREHDLEPFTVTLHCIAAGAYGGLGCTQSFAGRSTGWYYITGGYDEKTANYVYRVNDPPYMRYS